MASSKPLSSTSKNKSATKVKSVAKVQPVVSYQYPKWSLARDGETYDEQQKRILSPSLMKESKWTAEDIKLGKKNRRKREGLLSYRIPKAALTPIIEPRKSRVKTHDGNEGYVSGPGATGKDGKVWIRLHHTRAGIGESYMEWEAVQDLDAEPIRIQSVSSQGERADGVLIFGKLGADSQGYWIRALVGETADSEYLWEWQRIKTTSNDLRILRQRYRKDTIEGK